MILFWRTSKERLDGSRTSENRAKPNLGDLLFLPKLDPTDEEPQYIGFFHTGAYQESLAGYGGIQHCLVPAPKHVLIDKDEDGKITTKLFAKEQSYKSMLKILGY